jgi:hypothetical protein
LSFLFTLEEDKLAAQLPDLFDDYEREIAKAEPLFDIKGERLEMLARDLPQHQGHYNLKMQEMKMLMKWLENYKAKLEAIHLKNYSRGQRALSASDQKIFLAGESNIIELNQLIIEATLMHGKLEAIVDSFRQMGWMVGNITKLRVAELQEVIL